MTRCFLHPECVVIRVIQCFNHQHLASQPQSATICHRASRQKEVEVNYHTQDLRECYSLSPASIRSQCSERTGDGTLQCFLQASGNKCAVETISNYVQHQTDLTWHGGNLSAKQSASLIQNKTT